MDGDPMNFAAMRRALDAQRAEEDAHRDACRARPEDYRCRACRVVRHTVRHRQDLEFATCHSCATLIARGRLPAKVSMTSADVVSARVAAGLTQAQLARLCDWSQPRQAAIEARGSMLTRTAIRIARVLERFSGGQRLLPEILDLISRRPELEP